MVLFSNKKTRDAWLLLAARSAEFWSYGIANTGKGGGKPPGRETLLEVATREVELTINAFVVEVCIAVHDSSVFFLF